MRFIGLGDCWVFSPAGQRNADGRNLGERSHWVNWEDVVIGGIKSIEKRYKLKSILLGVDWIYMDLLYIIISYIHDVLALE